MWNPLGPIVLDIYTVPIAQLENTAQSSTLQYSNEMTQISGPTCPSNREWSKTQS